jgi:transposase
LDHQSRSPVPSKKKARDRLIAYASQRPDWAIGFADEVWWSRFALPAACAWQRPKEPVHLVEQSWRTADPDPKALACYGVLWQTGSLEQPERSQIWLRFVTGRPVSAITLQFLDWCTQRLAEQGTRQWLLIWDNASWHVSKRVRLWIRAHNRQVKQTGQGVRILPFRLPKQSPWLNPIEPKWVHGKRQVVERDGVLSAQELAERICAYFGCPYEPHLVLSEHVA